MFSDPEKNIKQFALDKGDLVADIGSGAGFYTIAAAQAMEGEGKVYAIDVQRELLNKLKSETDRLQLTNVDIIWADVEGSNGTKLRDAAVDSVIIANTLFQINDKDTFIGEINRILKPSGRVLFIDWSDSFGGLGPETKSIVTEKSAENLFLKFGFNLERNIQAGEHHYGIIFRKPI